MPRSAINSECCDINNNVMQYLNPAAFRAVPLNSMSRQTVRAGNVGVGQFRLPGLKNLDVSLSKAFPIGGQRRIELRADMLNALNWINYAAVQTNITASDFGRITGTGRRPRGAAAGPFQLLIRAFRRIPWPARWSRAGRSTLCDMLRHRASGVAPILLISEGLWPLGPQETE